MKNAEIKGFDDIDLLQKDDEVLVKVLTKDPLQAGFHYGRVCKITKKAIQVRITTNKEKGYGFIVRVKKTIR